MGVYEHCQRLRIHSRKPGTHRENHAVSAAWLWEGRGKTSPTQWLFEGSFKKQQD